MTDRLPELLDCRGLMAEPTTVYIARQRRAVLYVGITGRNLRRLHAHARASAWWPRATKIELRHLPSREQAEELERKLIAECAPPFNVRHNTRDVEEERLPPGLLDVEALGQELGVSRRIAELILRGCPAVWLERRRCVERTAVREYIDRHTYPPGSRP